MKNKLVLSILLFLCSFSFVFAQEVEVLYTKSALDQAMAYKESLKVDKVNMSNALMLMNVSEARERAYLEKISSSSAAIILGESGLKAAGAIDFTLPLITINALGETSAKGPVIRVLESDFDGSAPNAKTVSDAGAFALTADDLKDGKETIIKCQGVVATDLVNKLLSEIVRLRK